MAGGSAAGSLKPTHRPSTSASSYLLITRRPSASSSAQTQSTPTRRLKRPYPLIALSLVDVALTLFYAVGAQRIIGVLRFCVISIFVGSSKGWRARSGSIMIACVGSILSVLWEACNAAMAGQSGWKSPAAMTTAAFSVFEYLTFVFVLRLSPHASTYAPSHAITYETRTIPTPRTPSRHDDFNDDELREEDGDDVSSISSSEIVDLPPPRSPARITVDPAGIVRRRSALFFGRGEHVDEDEQESEGDDAEEREAGEDRLGKSLSRSWKRRSALERDSYGTFS